jgi:hypothetical protein
MLLHEYKASYLYWSGAFAFSRMAIGLVELIDTESRKAKPAGNRMPGVMRGLNPAANRHS